MTENATIFIPDISGFTDFLSRTELEHSSHIINELLELLVEANVSDCILAEVEGDALLFYRKGDALSWDTLMRQCMEMFSAFHTRLKLIERDSICQCGACQTATNLTLKFIVHYGPIREIKVSNFTKASGIDMIIAHRLLKNNIPSNEYILTTQRYLDVLTDRASDISLTWSPSSESYPAIGQLDFQFALLDGIKGNIAAPPPPESAAYTLGTETVGVDIDIPMMHVYELLIEMDNRNHWIPGLQYGESDIAIDRLGAKHLCIFDDDTYEVVPLKCEIAEDTIHYAELYTAVRAGLVYSGEFVLVKIDEEHTRVEITIGEVPEKPLDEEIRRMVVHEWLTILETFKVFAENGPSS